MLSSDVDVHCCKMNEKLTKSNKSITMTEKIIRLSDRLTRVRACVRVCVCFTICVSNCMVFAYYRVSLKKRRNPLTPIKKTSDLYISFKSDIFRFNILF